MMRQMALNMARVIVEKKKTSMQSKLKRAGWNNDFLLETMQGMRYGMAKFECDSAPHARHYPSRYCSG
ncbi:MAG: hypothetical protein OXC82_06835 [Rhodobacteraceae bacterium]|nr:hypothetical protein [Paracoccaceae bacterium]